MKQSAPLSQFGDAAVGLGYLSADQVRDALEEQARRRGNGALGSPIGSLLRERGLLTPKQITLVLQQLSGGNLPLSEDGIRLAARLKVIHASTSNVIGITGTLAGDVAQTTVEIAVALAVMAQGQVLVVDANLRAPSLHKLMEMPLAPGLSEHIALGADAPPPMTTQVAALSAVPSGAPVADFLATCMSPEAAAVIEGFRQQHRYVIVNLGPINIYPEAAVTASRCDGVLTVLHAGRSNKKESNDLQRMLEGLDVRHSGIVIARHASQSKRQLV